MNRLGKVLLAILRVQLILLAVLLTALLCTFLWPLGLALGAFLIWKHWRKTHPRPVIVYDFAEFYVPRTQDTCAPPSGPARSRLKHNAL